MDPTPVFLGLYLSTPMEKGLTHLLVFRPSVCSLTRVGYLDGAGWCDRSEERFGQIGSRGWDVFGYNYKGWIRA